MARRAHGSTPGHDAWLLWRVAERCSLHCQFCYEPPEALTRGVAPPIEVEPLLAALDRSGRTFSVMLTGGEPFLVPNIVEAARAIAERHFVSFNTNLISPRVRELVGQLDPRRVLDSMASLHVEELARTGLTDRFVDHYRFLRDNGFASFQAVEVAFPPYAAEAEAWIASFRQRGVKLLFEPFVGDFAGRSFPADYTEAELSAFRLNRLPGFRVSNHYQRGAPCNAGVNVAVVDPDGTAHPCWDIETRIGRIDGAIQFRDELTHCPVDRCLCPVNRYDTQLFDAACRLAGEP